MTTTICELIDELRRTPDHGSVEFRDVPLVTVGPSPYGPRVEWRDPFTGETLYVAYRPHLSLVRRFNGDRTASGARVGKKLTPMSAGAGANGIWK